MMMEQKGKAMYRYKQCDCGGRIDFPAFFWQKGRDHGRFSCSKCRKNYVLHISEFPEYVFVSDGSVVPYEKCSE